MIGRSLCGNRKRKGEENKKRVKVFYNIRVFYIFFLFKKRKYWDCMRLLLLFMLFNERIILLFFINIRFYWNLDMRFIFLILFCFYVLFRLMFYKVYCF